MTPNTDTAKDGFDKIPFRMHPRVFAALGTDLVTNDVVAVIELVKNSYDAFAQNVWIRFKTDQSSGDFIEIEDDGGGMTRKTIEDVWCLVATPHKEEHPFATSGRKKRRVAGEKGLGRLSVARLGTSLNMLTKSPDTSCVEVWVDWTSIAEGNDLSNSFAECREYPEKSPVARSGTRLRIHGLKSQWDESRVSDLRENLARLISPFSALGDFRIFLSGFGEDESQEVEIESPEFLSKPKYRIKGEVDDQGNIEATYLFSAIADGGSRSKALNLPWKRIYENSQDRTRFPFDSENSSCGAFSFEIRAWDIAADDTQEIAERFDFQKSQVRRAIRAHKGISVYRDGVLVLPKSDNARDWLGLDLRRVSKVGTRLSTSQLVGYVSITAEANTKIEDTSDRERLTSCLEVAEFEEILKAIVALLEGQRDEDRVKPERERPMEDIFEGLSAHELVDDVVALAEEGADASEAVPRLRAFSESMDIARKTIQERFVYYSRLATVGTIAQMIVHEIRSRTTAFGSFLDFIKNRLGPFRDKDIEEEVRRADKSVDALERLADTFAPLASRGFTRRRRQSVLEDQIRDCLTLHRSEIAKGNVRCHVPDSKTPVAVDPGELDAILLNLIVNSAYWMDDVPKDKRELEFRVVPVGDRTRVRVWVHDTGPGIDKEDLEKVFWPGVTRKPGGIGMGLTVASELVAAYGGRMSIKHPGTKGGASFAFDLPLKTRG